MAQEQLGHLLHYLRRLAGTPAAGLSDGQLLERFAARHDGDAFAQVVQRHAPLVWGVCRRLLHQEQDAEDAFQATFLVLARKAASVRWRADVGNWLYAVAVRTARKAKAGAARRRRQEREILDMPASEPAGTVSSDDLRPILDEEINRLPAKYRAPVVLHYLEGKTYAQAAQSLGWAEGTVATRLARARQLLRARLTRRGLALSAGLVAGMLSQTVAPAVPPTALLEATSRAGLLAGAGRAAAGLISARILTLTEGVLRAMLLTKLKLAVGLVLVLGVLGVGAGVLSHRMVAAQLPNGPQGAGPATPSREADPPGEEKLRQEVERLNRELLQMKERMAALEARSGPPGGGAQPVLTYQGKSTDYWINQLKDRSPDYRVPAVLALGGIAEEDPKIIPVLVGTLKDRDDSVRRSASNVLAKLGPAAVPALVEVLKDDRFPKAQESAAWALSGGGAAAVPPLTKALQDSNQGVRSHAAEALGRIGPQAKAAVPALLKALNDRNPRVRSQAAAALGQIGPDAAAATPSLTRIVQEETSDNWVRSAAATSLWWIDPIAALRAGLPRKTFSEEFRILEASERIDVTKVVPALIQGLKDKDPHVRARAAEVLAEIHEERAIPALREALKDEDPQVRRAATRALGQFQGKKDS